MNSSLTAVSRAHGSDYGKREGEGNSYEQFMPEGWRERREKERGEERKIEAWKSNPDEHSKQIFNSLKKIQFEDGVTISKVTYIWNKGGNKTIGFELKGREYPHYGLDGFILVDTNQLEQRKEMPIQKDIDTIKTATGNTGGRRRDRHPRTALRDFAR